MRVPLVAGSISDPRGHDLGSARAPGARVVRRLGRAAGVLAGRRLARPAPRGLVPQDRPPARAAAQSVHYAYAHNICAILSFGILLTWLKLKLTRDHRNFHWTRPDNLIALCIH